MRKNNTNIKHIAKLLHEADHAAIICHIKPDADSVGSALALARTLKILGKKCKVYCDACLPARFFMLDGAEEIENGEIEAATIYIAVDCANAARAGKYTSYFQPYAKNTLNIDHHPSNDRYASYNYVTDYASTAEIVMEIIDALGVEIDSQTAACLMSGIVTDTGSFANKNTDSRVFEAAARLIKLGVDINEINFTLRRAMSIKRSRLLGNALSKLRLYHDRRTAMVINTYEDLKRFECTYTDTDGFVEQAINIDTALIGISITEDTPGRFQVSMRSRKNIDVSSVCAAFGGGGHRVAAGCVIFGPLEEVVERIVCKAGFQL